MAYVSTYRDAHPSCPQPETGDVYVWRYLDLARLVSIVANKKLNLPRVDKLGDEFEGSVTRGVMERFAQQYPDGDHVAALKQFRQETWVSCWHENESESEAMWRLYCQPHDGVALRTTYQRLDDSLPDAMFLGQVTYVDYEGTGIVPTLEVLNGFGPMMHKRTAFAHEREIRKVVFGPLWPVRHQVRYLEPPPIPADAVSFAIDWDVEKVVESVWVSPYAHEWSRRHRRRAQEVCARTRAATAMVCDEGNSAVLNRWSSGNREFDDVRAKGACGAARRRCAQSSPEASQQTPRPLPRMPLLRRLAERVWPPAPPVVAAGT
jgi:hypothetical protein